jgi:D-alanine-D-alanine ligase
MKVAVIYNKRKDVGGVINVFGMQNLETYNPKIVERVAAALEQGGHNVRVIDGNINVIEQLQNFMPRVVQGEKPGMVFNMAYGIQGISRYTHIPSLLEMLGVPYVGSSPAGHGIALDKVTTKVMVQAAGLPTAPYWVFYKADQIPDDIPFPVITKPKMEAVSLGIQVIHDLASLKTAISDLVDQFKQPVLVEKFIPGREFAVGLLGNHDPETLPIVEIDLGGDPFAIQSLDDKLKKPKEKICPARIDEDIARELRRLTRETFSVLGIYDFCRVDFRMDKEGRLYILELNSMASLGLTGTYVHAAGVAGYTYESLINRMLDVAVERYFGGEQFEQVKVGETEGAAKKDPLRVRLRSYLRGNLVTMEDYLAKMVDINSNYNNIEGVNSLGRWASNQLSALGFHRQVHSRAELGNILYFANHMEENNDILLVGNLDNSIDSQDFTQFTEERGRIYGSGVARGKGGLAILLGALKALRHTRSLRKIKCGILLISDYSRGGRSSRTVLEEVSARSRYVVGLSGAGLAGEILTSSFGSLQYDIEINQRPGHNLLKSISEKEDPILYIDQKITALKKFNSDPEGTHIVLNGIKTGGAPGLPAHYALLSFLIRYRSTSLGTKLDEQVQHLFESPTRSLIKTLVSRGLQRKPFLKTELSQEFFHKVEKIAKTVEVRVKPSDEGIASLLAYCGPQVPALDGFGPVTGGIGSKAEYIIRDSLIDRSVLLAYLIYKSSKNFAA